MVEQDHLSEDFDDKYEAEENRPNQGFGRAATLGFSLLCVGVALTIWYGVSLYQVSQATVNPIYTELGVHLFLPTALLAIVFVVALVAFLIVLARTGVTTRNAKYANMTQIPWDLVATYSVVGAVIVFVLAVLVRVAAEIQIVGAQNIAWYGDLALGSLFLVAGFVLCFAVFGLFFHQAIKQQRKLEDESNDVSDAHTED